MDMRVGGPTVPPPGSRDVSGVQQVETPAVQVGRDAEQSSGVSQPDKFAGNAPPTKDVQLKGNPETAQGLGNKSSIVRLLAHLGGTVHPTNLMLRLPFIKGFTSPDHIIDYARSMGFNAEAYNNGTLQELTAFIHQGVPVLALTQPLPNPELPQVPIRDQEAVWVLVKGETEEGALSFFILEDANQGKSVKVSQEQFLQVWEKAKGLGVPSEFERFMLVIAPYSFALPEGRFGGRLHPKRALMRGFLNLKQMVTSLKKFRLLSCLFSWGGGLVSLVGGSLGLLILMLGLVLIRSGAWFRNNATLLFETGGLFMLFAFPLDVIGFALCKLGELFEGIGIVSGGVSNKLGGGLVNFSLDIQEDIAQLLEGVRERRLKAR